MDLSRFGRLAIVLAVGLTATFLGAPHLWARAPSTGVLQIEKALDEASSAEFIEEPLEDVAAYFSELHGIGIHIDRKALEEVGLDESESITVSTDGIQLGTMLALILEPHGLTWTIRHDILVITTCEAARKSVSTRIYLVDELSKRTGFVQSSGDPGPMASGSPLLDVITTTIEPQSWMEAGPGRASMLTIGGQTVFIIRQDYRTHRLIRQLLDDLALIGDEKSKVEEDLKVPAKVPSRTSASPAARDPFALPSKPPRPADDPFGAPAPAGKNPFGSPSKPPRPANDPFGGRTPANDPFGSPSEPARPANDPFGAPAPAANDPFGAPSKPPL